MTEAVANKDNALAVQRRSPSHNLTVYLHQNRQQLQAALPKQIPVERMIQVVATAYSQSKALQSCDQGSIYQSILLACQMGLEPGVLGQGYLIPYGTKCQFVPGWQGICDLVSRTGRGIVWTGAVFQGDQFEYELGSNPYVKHRPGSEDDPNLMTHVYAVGEINGCNRQILEVWTMEKILKHRDRWNKVGNAHYSFQHPEMYARKIPLLQVCKYMPKSVELSNALQASYAADTGQTYEQPYVTANDEPARVEPPAATPPVTREREAARTTTRRKPEGIATTITEPPPQTATKLDMSWVEDYDKVAPKE